MHRFKKYIAKMVDVTEAATTTKVKYLKSSEFHNWLRAHLKNDRILSHISFKGRSRGTCSFTDGGSQAQRLSGWFVPSSKKTNQLIKD